jgi:hypothetical protein
LGWLGFEKVVTACSHLSHGRQCGQWHISCKVEAPTGPWARFNLHPWCAFRSRAVRHEYQAASRRSRPTREVLIRTDVIANRVNRPTNGYREAADVDLKRMVYEVHVTEKVVVLASSD